MSAFIEIQHLTKCYGPHFAIKDLSLSIRKGEIVGLIGPNGAGKSTTLNILAGIVQATSGEAYIGGENIAFESFPQKCSVGLMLENVSLPKNLRVGEFLRYRAIMKGVNSSEVRVHVEKQMKIGGLGKTLKQSKISTLSQGYQQRVSFVDAILGSPELVILDEPTINLDPSQMNSFRQLISSFRGKKTFIISSHILSELEPLCTHFIILNQGQIVADGSLESLKSEFFDERVLEVTVNADFEVVNQFKSAYPHINIQEKSQSFQKNTFELSFVLEKKENYTSLLETVVSFKKWKILKITEPNVSLEKIFLRAIQQR